MSNSPDVVIVGGGIIGLTTAYFLAQDGLKVELFERGDLGQEASWAGAGIIPPGRLACAATPADQLRAIGSESFPAFSEELRELTGIDNGYWRCGAIEFLGPDDGDVLQLWQNEQINFSLLSTIEVAQLEPQLATNIVGQAYWLPECGQVRNPWHLRALIAACTALGVRLHSHASVRKWLLSGDQIEAAILDDGRSVLARNYLITAGCWSEECLVPLGCRPNIRPVRGQIVLFKPAKPLLSHVVMLGKEYLVPRADGRVLVGSTEEPEAGFEKANTPAGVEHLTALATATVPGLHTATIERTWSGLCPGTPDGLPILGRLPGWENVFVAAGHFRAGVQLSIGTGRVMSELMTRRPLTVDLEEFRPNRPPISARKAAFRS